MEIRSILVPCDFSESSRAAFEFASGLAQRTGARLCLVHAFFVPLDLEAMSVIGVQQVFERVEQEGSEKLDSWAKEAERAGLECRQIALRGLPEDVILDVARSHEVDLIVMGTTGRSGVAHLLLGSRAERVLRGAVCPVITVRGRSPVGARSEAEQTA